MELECPKCFDQEMIVRANGVTGEEFLGCLRYPQCDGTLELPLSIIKELRGDPRLPGM